MKTNSPKPFKTYEEQIGILKKRGLIVDDEPSAIAFLESNSYYNVINGYKEPFVKINSEDFLPDVKFNYIKTLYLFDKSLRHSILNILLDIETTIKAVMSYEFAKLYGELNYCEPSCFRNTSDQEKSKFTAYIKRIEELTKAWLSSNNISYQNIKHYNDIHRCIPIWVLCSHLNISDISKMYACLKDEAQKNICNHLVSIYGKPFSPEFLYRALWILSDIRNLCAHNQRLYNFTTTKHFKSRNNQFIKSLLIEFGDDFEYDNIVSLGIILHHLAKKDDINSCFAGFINETSELMNLSGDFVLYLAQKNKAVYDFIRIMLNITK